MRIELIEHGWFDETLNCFEKTELDDIVPDSIAYLWYFFDDLYLLRWKILYTFCVVPLATLILMPMEDIFYGKEKWKVTSMHVIVTLRNTKFMCRICFRYFEVFTCVLHFRTAILKHLPYLLTKYFNISQKIKCF